MMKVSIDLSKVQSSLRQLSKEVGKTASENIVEVAIIGSRQLATSVEPFGLTGKAEKIAKGAIFKDVGRAYYDTGRTYNALKKISPRIATAYSIAINKGETQKAEDIARKVITGFDIQVSDSGQHLEDVRNNNGRVPDGATPMGISSKSNVEQIKAKKSLTAGLCKAGWLQAGASLGAKTRIPKWLKKSYNLGSSSKDFGGGNKSVTLINKVKYASKLLTQSKINKAVLNAFRNQRTRMTKQLEAMAKKF